MPVGRVWPEADAQGAHIVARHAFADEVMSWPITSSALGLVVLASCGDRPPRHEQGAERGTVGAGREAPSQRLR